MCVKVFGLMNNLMSMNDVNIAEPRYPGHMYWHSSWVLVPRSYVLALRSCIVAHRSWLQALIVDTGTQVICTGSRHVYWHSNHVFWHTDGYRLRSWVLALRSYVLALKACVLAHIMVTDTHRGYRHSVQGVDSNGDTVCSLFPLFMISLMLYMS